MQVKLPGTPRSKFWRFHTQGVSDGSVCTIEALHLLAQALAPRLAQPASSWDNLLWYFAHQHSLIAKVKAAKQHNKQQDQQQQAAPPSQGEAPARQAKRCRLDAEAAGATAGNAADEAGGITGEHTGE